VGWGESGVGNPILTSLENDKGGILDRSRGPKGLEVSQNNRTGGLVLSVDVVVAGGGTHREQD